MNDSTDTKDIDSYGVWVKRPPQDSPDKEKSLDELLDTGDFDSISTFPDFSEPDAQADTKIDDKADDFSNAASEDSLDFDTTLTVDELSNISDTTGITEDEPAADTSADSLVADDFFPDFDDSGTGGKDKTTEVSADSFGDEDISLDDFMTEDSIDPNPPAAPETSDSGTSTADDDGEISLDDFLDDASFGGDDSQKEDDVSNDAPLDIDLNFNESPSEQVEVEDTPEEDDDDDIEIKDEEFDDMFDKISSSGQDNSGLSDSAATSEEVSLDDFNTDSNVGNAEKDSNASEDVDLSAFGIDSDADETPVTSNVQESKKVEVVDYDLSISDDAETTAAPKVAIVQDSSPEPVNKEETENVSTQLLKQIVADLSGLKSEINTLKSEFEELKSRDFSETQSRSKNTEPDVIEVPEEEENTGFFSGRDEDETIALSGDELNNIMQTADFSDDELAMPESSDEVVEDSPEESGSQTDSFDIPEESAVQEKTEDSFTDFTDTAEADTENSSSVEDLSKTQPAEQTEETVINEDKTLDGADTLTQDSTEESFTEPATIEEPDVVDESEHFTDDEPFSAITEDEIVIPEEEHDSGLSLDVESETLEEPDLNDIDTMNIPQEISIPKVDDVGETEETSDEAKVDDILVESSSTDLMNSVKESTLESTAEDTVEPVEETSVSEEVENIEDDGDKTEEEPAVTTNGSSDPLFDEIMAEEPSISETLSKESVDYLAEEEIIKDNPQTQENPSEESNEETPESTDIPSDLKSDIKSVLLYMDQLLENLPEEKIMEFAKSEQFVTYKKLFAELGLS